MNVNVSIRLSPIEDKLIVVACDEKQNCMQVKTESFSFGLIQQRTVEDVAIEYLNFAFAQISPQIVSTILKEKK